VDELAEMRDDMEAFVERWVQRSEAHEATVDDDAEPVVLVYQAYRRP